MNSFLFLFVIILFYLIIFTIFPRVIHIFVKKLLFYHKYDDLEFNKHPVWFRTKKVIKVYIWMSLGLSFIFGSIFGLDNQILFGIIPRPLFFVVSSFFLIFTIRISILMNKTQLIKQCNDFMGKIMDDLNKNYKYWRELKDYISSFLFSVILFGILTATTLFLINEVRNYTYNTLILRFSGIILLQFAILIAYLLSILIFIFFFSILGEYSLYKIGVREDCQDNL